ncbi:STAS domain-containing protein [Nonomuraea helvata]|uniref:Anti-sigma factor antagonist n=1 Tax=Nonomuraea helvata TaxID=37484 RepID=A0ABV5S5G5_9ACTN
MTEGEDLRMHRAGIRPETCDGGRRPRQASSARNAPARHPKGMTQLTITIKQRPRFALLELEEELDHQTHPALLHALDGLLTASRPRIVVDTAQLEFCDSHGLWVLIDAQSRAEKRGGALRLIGVQGSLARLLTVTQLVDLFPPYSDLTQAPAWPARD